MTAQAHISFFDMPAEARAARSFVRQFVNAIMESRQRQAEEFMAEYNRAHRYPAAEKLEIIQLVEQSHLPVRRSLEQIGIPRPV